MTYTYTNSNNKVYCMRYYAGKTVKGIAKCAPADTFNLEDGKKLARARCDAKVAEKRLKRITKKFEEAREELVAAANKAEYMQQLFEEAINSLNKANWDLQELENNL